MARARSGIEVMNKSTIYENVLTASEINDILSFYSDKTDTQTENGIVNKNLEYHIPDNFIYKLLYPKLSKILGPSHDFDGGAYKEGNTAYGIHVDTGNAHYEIGSSLLSTSEKQHDVSVLIPLVEGPKFKTVTFDIFDDGNYHDKLAGYQQTRNQLLAEDFSHENFTIIQNLPVDIEFEWRLGSVLVWPRTQWHASTNFAQYNVVKKFLILFIK